MRVLVTGYTGQLGYEVVHFLADNGIECQGTNQSDFNIVNEIDVKEYIRHCRPDVIVHCAAYTAVDEAEVEKELCYDVNVNGTKYIAEIAEEINAKIVYISTDYIFSGDFIGAHEVDDVTSPVNYYGYTKLMGENLVRESVTRYFILRVSWVFGRNGKNFVNKMIELSKSRNELSVVGDQIGSPTYAVDLAYVISKIIQTDKYGIYHVTNEGYCSWYEFAKEIFRLTNKDITVNKVLTEAFPTSAARPKNSRLSKNSLAEAGLELLPHWTEALSNYLNENKSIWMD